MSKKKQKHYAIFSISVLTIGLTIIVFMANGFLNPNYKLDPSYLGTFGDFIGGFLGTILTIIATVYIYKTYHSQKKELKSQKKELTLQRQLIAQQQFETTFFNMLNVHRELKKGLKLNYLDFFDLSNELTYSDIYEGVNVFEKIASDYKDIYKNLETLHYNRSRISNRVVNNKLLDPQFLWNLSQDESNPRPVMLAYEIDSDWNENNNKIETHKEKILFTFDLLYMNYQNTLSHYCRNVYHILKFIRKTEEEDIYTKIDKTTFYKQYANILQSQLNVNEHFILFYNFIWHYDNDQESNIYFPMNIVNHYRFLENVGVNNLILNNHKKQYTFPIKGDS